MTDAIGDFARCRWPACDCYAPQGLQQCRRARLGLPRHRVVPFPDPPPVVVSTSQTEPSRPVRKKECVNA